MDTENWAYVIGYHNRALTSAEEWNLEKSFNEDKVFNWFKENSSLPSYLCTLYVIIIFVGQYYMESRPKFDLRRPLLCWSLFLAIFSIIGSIRTVIPLIKLYNKGGIKETICGNTFYVGPVSRFWGMAFSLSKAPELVDTVFIVLRKQKLIFLHWYHHITVLLFTWYCYEGQRSGGAIFMTMNFVVHGMMYSYYTLRAARFRVPRFIAMIVTSMQILQMVIGCMTFLMIHNHCKDKRHVLYGVLMYGSYLVLFCHFFLNTYLKPSANDKKIDATQSSTSDKAVDKLDVPLRKTIEVNDFTEGMVNASSHNLRKRNSMQPRS